VNQKLSPFHRAGLAAAGVLLVLFFAPALLGAPVRVVTWNLQPRDVAGTDPSLLAAGVTAEAAQVLKGLNPDIIVLQQVPDAATCEALVQGLRPADFQVAVVSAIRDPQSGTLLRQQTAILSRGRASNPTWDTWKTLAQTVGAPGGFASAIIHLDNRSVAVFAVQIGGISSVIDVERESLAQQSAREDAARQLIQQVDALREATEPVQSVFIAGDLNTSPDDPKLARELTLTRLDRAGFASAFGDLPPEKRITLPGYGTQSDVTVDYIYTRDARSAGVRVVPVNTTLHYPVSGDLEIGSAALAGSPATTPFGQINPSSTPAGSAVFSQSLVGKIGAENIWWLSGLLAGGIGCVVAGILLLGRGGNSGGNSGLTETSPSGGGMSVLSPPNAGEILIMTRTTQTGSAMRTGPVAEASPVVHVQGSALPTSGTDAEEWRRRAEQAERRAERSAGVIREGLLQQLSQWVKGGIVRQLASDRAELIQAQREAAQKMQSVDQRLTKVEIQIQQRMREYEHRITELEKELTAAREENREMIRAKIAQVRAEMERERTRMLQDA